MMKHYSLYILISLLGLAFLNSCTDEDMAGKKEQVIEGVPVGLTMSVTPVEGQKVTTRVAIDEEDENAVFNVWIFIFDYSSKQIEFIKEYTMSAAATSATVDVPVGEIVSGEKYIYAIANTDGELTSLNREFTKEVIPNVESLMKITSSLGQEDVQRLGGHLLMGGAYDENGKEEGYCNIQPPVSGNVVNLTGSIKLLHVDSSIRFDVSTAEGISFIPKSWKVINVPKTTNVIGQTTDASTDYFDYSAKSFDTNKLEGTEYKGGAFTFYMFENRKDAKNPPAEMTYEDRERQEKLNKGGSDDHTTPYNGEYLYADKYATYVEMTGTYTGNWYDKKEEITKNISAEVKYTVHLGCVDGFADFKSKRNLSYTYKIQIAGVDKIIAEVEASQISGQDAKEEQPGAEGNVVIATQNLYLDSHYETRTVRFSKNSLANLTVKVETPYASGSFSISGDGSAKKDDSFSDYNWVKFVKNDKSDGFYKDEYQMYPGDAFRNDGDEPATYNEEKQSNGHIVVKKYLTIDQLLRNLYYHKNDENDNNTFWDQNGDVIYTVFVDEYYYQNKGSYDDWKAYVNGSSRKMHILCNTQYSYDNESSVTKSSILINQRPIQTIYNTGNSNLQTAWGIETKDETPGLVYGGEQNDNTSFNGRYLTYKRIKSSINESWSDYINIDDNTLSQRDAAYACLQRNRDLNGNGQIDKNEIRWYLPSTTQYTGLWIGKDALTPEAQLFQKDPKTLAETNLNHYVSSNGVRFWAEEGASTGANSYNNNSITMVNTPFNTRCARNLGGYYGNEIDDIDEEPVDYADPMYYSDNQTVVEIDLTNLNPDARRKYKVETLLGSGEHTGADLNRPYKKFQVNKENKSSCASLGTGWRIPNQRELALFVGYTKNQISKKWDGWSSVCPGIKSCTYSDLGYKTNQWFVSFTDTQGLNVVSLKGENTASHIRCVKDVD